MYLLKFWMQIRYTDGAAKDRCQKQNSVDEAFGRLTLFNRAIHQVLTGIDSHTHTHY